MSKAAPSSNADFDSELTKAEQTARNEIPDLAGVADVEACASGLVVNDWGGEICTVDGPVVVASTDSPVEQAASDADAIDGDELEADASSSTLIEARRKIADA